MRAGGSGWRFCCNVSVYKTAEDHCGLLLWLLSWPQIYSTLELFFLSFFVFCNASWVSGSLWRYFCHYMSLSLCHESKGDHHEAIQLSLILQCLYAFRYCTESRVFVCFKLLQILYRICSVCMLQAAPDTVQNLCLHASRCTESAVFVCMLQAASRYCT